MMTPWIDETLIDVRADAEDIVLTLSWKERDRRRCPVAGAVICRLQGREVHDLVESGDLDPRDWHQSLYWYARREGLLNKDAA